MRFLQTLPMAIAIVASALLVSCDKEAIDKFQEEIIDTPNDSTDSNKSQVLVFNGSDNLNLDNLIVRINGLPIVKELNLNEITDYIQLDAAENVIIEVVDELGHVLVTRETNLTVGVSNILAITLGPDGVTAILDIVKVTDSDFLLDQDLISKLKIADLGGADGLFNIVNLSNLGDDQLFAGLDILQSNGTARDAIMDLTRGELTQGLPLNSSFLNNIDILSSNFLLEDVLNVLVGRDKIDGFDDLGGIALLSGVGDILEGVVRILDGLLGGLFDFRGQKVDFDIVNNNILDNINLDKVSDYTLIITGEAGDLDFTWINQTVRGLR